MSPVSDSNRTDIPRLRLKVGNSTNGTSVPYRRRTVGTEYGTCWPEQYGARYGCSFIQYLVLVRLVLVSYLTVLPCRITVPCRTYGTVWGRTVRYGYLVSNSSIKKRIRYYTYGFLHQKARLNKTEEKMLTRDNDNADEKMEHV